MVNYISVAKRVEQLKPIRRWTPRIKAYAVWLIATGKLVEAQFMRTYGVSSCELNLWRRLYDEFGLQGLRVTHVDRYRRAA